MQEQGALTVVKRDGRSVEYDADRIETAVAKAFRADLNLKEHAALDAEFAEEAAGLARSLTRFVAREYEKGPVSVELIQDEVERELMRRGHYGVAKRYILYREQHTRARILEGKPGGESDTGDKSFSVVLADGTRQRLDVARIKRQVRRACKGLEKHVDAEAIIEETYRSLFDGARLRDVQMAMVLAARSRVERHPTYGRVAARLLLNIVYREVFGKRPEPGSEADAHRQHFTGYIEEGVAAERLSPELLTFDMDRIVAALKPERDDEWTYLGLQTIYDRYLIHIDGRRIESPQFFWMRVAMGLSLGEKEDREGHAIQFYEMLSTRRFVSSTPTLFNSGTPHPQCSSCYLSTTEDDLDHIFKVISDNARLSKWAGGLGNDWTSVRATGSWIKGTNGASQGIIPFLKVVNDTAVAVNQGGKRRGAVCSYLETWHLDIESFLDLRKNTGDERRRTHDMHTAHWIPDLFMKRVATGGNWTLFSPSETPDLHDLTGRAFEERYRYYELLAQRDELRQHKTVEALTLWRRMLSMLFETGHPWITFKDPCNIRSPQDHAGVVHSSNLCTEITLNTSAGETAVCNLGSINLAAHCNEQGLDEAKLRETISIVIRMLDNVIDYNFYPTPEAKRANRRHRPVGLGLMGFADCLYLQRLPYNSEGAVAFADQSMELISHAAISASCDLAAERGPYPTFQGSKWSRGILPIDSIALLEKERDGWVDMDTSTTQDWDSLRQRVMEVGMRNSNVMAIAPTATISNIAGCSQSIEPTYRNLYVKSNLSGDFTIINHHLVNELEARGLWDEQMIDDLKYWDGQLSRIDRIPEDLKRIFVTAFDIEPHWLIEAASRRQKWIDQSQSLNLYIAQPSGKLLNDMYLMAWQKGLKTTYYLRSTAATQVEKATQDINKRGIQPRWMQNRSASGNIAVAREQQSVAEDAACSIDDPECEACQ